MIQVLRSKFFNDRPQVTRPTNEKENESLIRQLREELGMTIVNSHNLIRRLRISQQNAESTGYGAKKITEEIELMDKLSNNLEELDVRWGKIVLLNQGIRNGTIKKYFPNKGFGFIFATDQDRSDVFFHISNVHGIEVGELVGTPVFFMTELKKKGPTANWVIGDY